ncbi:hypothetical protein R5W24_003030 [Gemmata sp. JC717]|uniref:hypothetical protein n=1 Tax=Gemmata algarum TaxID=2975278 RepID=UPI0021BA6E55|nr:hypothetical protein [Gemmata algarum]MDY3553916.1 hypothetical protein [Gemmata algarum]
MSGRTIRFLHWLGLTNLTDDQIRRYCSIVSPTGRSGLEVANNQSPTNQSRRKIAGDQVIDGEMVLSHAEHMEVAADDMPPFICDLAPSLRGPFWSFPTVPVVAQKRRATGETVRGSRLLVVAGEREEVCGSAPV